MINDEYNDEYRQSMIYKTIGIYNSINRELDNFFRKYEISSSQFNILMIIKHQVPKSGTNQAEIAKKMVVCASNMTKLIDKLQEKKLIEKKMNSENRRNNIITITQKGSDLLDDIWIEYIDFVKKTTNSLDKEEREKLCQIISKWQIGLN